MKIFSIRGSNLVELIISLFILSILSFGFLGLSNFLNIKNNMAQMEIINQSFNEVKNILERGCPFKGESFVGNKIAVTKIQKGSVIFYVSSKDKSFSSKSHDLGEGVFILSMELEKISNIDFLFHIKYIYGEDSRGNELIVRKKFPINITLDSTNAIQGCSDVFCPEAYFVPEGNDFLDTPPCQNFVDSAIRLWKKKYPSDPLKKSIKEWRDKNPNPSETEKKRVPIHFSVPKTPLGESFRKVIKSQSGTYKCMCLGLFTCYQGEWSKGVKCFEFFNP